MECCSGKYPDYHTEVCFEDEHCPLCELNQEIKRLSKRIEELEKEE